jgi:hypothetical protein
MTFLMDWNDNTRTNGGGVVFLNWPPYGRQQVTGTRWW